MNGKSIEDRVHAVLGGAPTAEASAISEVQQYRAHPLCLSHIRKVVGPTGSDDDAVFLFAIKRAVLWL
jgi:hypothetical protein